MGVAIENHTHYHAHMYLITFIRSFGEHIPIIGLFGLSVWPGCLDIVAYIHTNQNILKSVFGSNSLGPRIIHKHFFFFLFFFFFAFFFLLHTPMRRGVARSQVVCIPCF